MTLRTFRVQQPPTRLAAETATTPIYTNDQIHIRYPDETGSANAPQVDALSKQGSLMGITTYSACP